MKWKPLFYPNERTGPGFFCNFRDRFSIFVHYISLPWASIFQLTKLIISFDFQIFRLLNSSNNTKNKNFPFISNIFNLQNYLFHPKSTAFSRLNSEIHQKFDGFLYFRHSQLSKSLKINKNHSESIFPFISNISNATRDCLNSRRRER